MLGDAYWRQAARAERLDEVREAILTGYLDGKPFTPYEPMVTMPPVTRVLDFGCGLGRNFPYLRTAAAQVVGFDLPEMIERGRRESVAGPGVTLSSDWEWVRRQRFDCAFVCLVFQHIQPGDLLRRFLPDLATMTPWLYVLSRGWSDFGRRSVFELVTASFTGSVCNVVEHDPDTHGLKLCGTIPLTEATADDRHYEALLTPASPTAFAPRPGQSPDGAPA